MSVRPRFVSVKLLRRSLGPVVFIIGALLLLSVPFTIPFSSTVGMLKTTQNLGAAVWPGVWAQLPEVTMGTGTLTLSWVASGPMELWVLNESQFAAFQVNATRHSSTQGIGELVYWGPVPHLWSYTYSAVSSTGLTANLSAGTYYLLASASKNVTVYSISETSPSSGGTSSRSGNTSYLLAGASGVLGIVLAVLGLSLWRQPRYGGKHLGSAWDNA